MTSPNTPKNILCIPAATVDRITNGARGFLAASSELLALLDHAELRPKTAELENDPTWRQVVCYGVLRHAGRLFAYRRAPDGSEGRLHGRGSIGVGGHVEECDCRRDPLVSGHDTVLYRAISRELKEEADIEVMSSQWLIGWLIDSTTPVEQVHIGAVFIIDLANDRVEPKEEIEPLGWFTLEELRAGKAGCEWEVWSRVLIEAGIAW